MCRMTHDQVVTICNADPMDANGFPLMLANTAANLIHADMIGVLATLIVELRRLRVGQATWPVGPRH